MGLISNYPELLPSPEVYSSQRPYIEALKVGDLEMQPAPFPCQLLHVEAFQLFPLISTFPTMHRPICGPYVHPTGGYLVEIQSGLITVDAHHMVHHSNPSPGFQVDFLDTTQT